MSRMAMLEMARALAAVPPVECLFEMGDTVTYTNEYGVKFEGLKIIGFETEDVFARNQEENFRPHAFIYLDWSSYWFSVGVERLELQHRHPRRAGFDHEMEGL